MCRLQSVIRENIGNLKRNARMPNGEDKEKYPFSLKCGRSGHQSTKGGEEKVYFMCYHSSFSYIEDTKRHSTFLR